MNIKEDWFPFLSEDFKMAWVTACMILFPIFVCAVGFGGFYHEGLEESGWSIMGAVQFGKMAVQSTAGCLAFWVFMGFIGRLFVTAWKIFG